ncbi:MAG: ABC transporter ATP-binding protein [Candidatus Eisenbacteria sp.]|nr:ABC transporter ATP-binding protein [Candidatus Eisenbacteria bacterium]
MTHLAIQCENLTRDFRDLRAVDGLDLEIEPGTIFAFLGPNGAGKTTTLQLLIGLLAPTAGSARVLGLDPQMDGEAVRSRIGVLLEDHGLYEELTAYDNMEFYGRLNRIPNPDRSDRIRTLLEKHGLWERRGERVRTFSRGMKQRLALARAMIARPRIMFLDEPTSGLDPGATRSVRETIRELASEEDITVFLNTHNLDEVERVSNRVGIIKGGRLLAFGSPQEVKARSSRGSVVIRTGGIPAAVMERMRNLVGVEKMSARDGEIRAVLGDGAKPSDLVQFLVGEGVAVSEVREDRASLEEVFLRIVEEDA